MPESVGIIGGGSWGTALSCLLARNGHSVDKRHVVLDETLRELGVYHIRIKLFQDVEARVRVFVTKQE